MSTVPSSTPITAAALYAAVAKSASSPGTTLVGRGETPVHDLTQDSREAGPGVAFVARKGARVDGHDFIPQVLAQGCNVVVVSERQPDAVGIEAQIITPDTGEILGPAAAAVHHHPSRDLEVVGITGTNGKTTTAFMQEAILRAAGRRTGVIGTIATKIADTVVPGVRTTPEASDTQRLLAEMRDEGVTSVAMEVSSHGLELGRVTGTRFVAVGFTNLSQDHLDFHPTMESYFAAKASLFDSTFTTHGVVCIDTPWGERLMKEANIPVTTVGIVTSLDTPSRPAVYATDLSEGPDGTEFTLHSGTESVRTWVPIPGRFNVSNALLAAGLSLQLGITLSTIATGISTMAPIPGRMEPVLAGQPFTVLVDYSHTPDSVRLALSAARRVTSNRVVVVLGCGGDRDRDKRPQMARAAQDGSDLAILTSDNPRSEDPVAIIEEMMTGLSDAEVLGASDSDAPSPTTGTVRCIPDRETAIAAALDAASPGDVVVIAGKGHETYQELADGRIEFDDRVVARRHLLSRGGDVT